MAELLSASLYHHGNYDVLRFWKDGSLLLGASDLTGRLWSGIMCRFEDADEAVAKDSTSRILINSLPGWPRQSCQQDDDDPETEQSRRPPPPAPLITSALLDSGVADAIALPLDDCVLADGEAGVAGHKAVLAYDSGSIEMFELVADETGQSTPMFVSTANMNEHDAIVSSLGLSCDRRKMVSSSYDKSIKIWSTDTWTSVATYLFAHNNHVLMVACHLEDPEIFASCSQDGRVLLWDTRQPRPANVLQKSTGVVPSALAWHPSSQGTKLIVGNELGVVELKDVRKVNENLAELKKLKRGITRLEFDPCSMNKIAVCADETEFIVLHLEEDIFSITYQNDAHKDFVRGAAWHPENRKLYTCAWDGCVMKHDINIQTKIQ